MVFVHGITVEHINTMARSGDGRSSKERIWATGEVAGKGTNRMGSSTIKTLLIVLNVPIIDTEQPKPISWATDMKSNVREFYHSVCI